MNPILYLLSIGIGGEILAIILAIVLIISIVAFAVCLARVVSLFSKYFEARAANGVCRQRLTTGSPWEYKHSRSRGRSSALTTLNTHREEP